MKRFSNILAAFVIGLLFVSIALNIVFIPKTIRKQRVELVAYEKPVIINHMPESSKQIEGQKLINHPTLIKIEPRNVRVYRDTIKHQYVDIAFTNRIQGELLSSKLVYKLKTSVYKPVFSQVQLSQKQRGRLYIAGKLDFSPSLNPEIGAFYIPGKSRIMAGYLYGIKHQTHSILIGYKL